MCLFIGLRTARWEEDADSADFPTFSCFRTITPAKEQRVSGESCLHRLTLGLSSSLSIGRALSMGSSRLRGSHSIWRMGSYFEIEIMLYRP